MTRSGPYPAATGAPYGSLPPRRRSAAARVLLLTLVAALVTGTVVVLAAATTGYPVTSPTLQSKSVWVTNNQQNMVGRLNKQTAEIDAEVDLYSGPPQLFQDGDTVVVADTRAGFVAVVDPITVVLGEKLAIPVGARIAYGGGVIAVVDPKKGRVWVRGVDQITEGDLAKEEPNATVGAGAQVAVGDAGTVYAVAAGADAVTVLPAGPPGGTRPAAVKAVIPGGPLSKDSGLGNLGVDPVSVTTVGDQLIALDSAARRIVVGESSFRSFPIGKDAGDELTLQQGGPTAATVLVASRTKLLQIGLFDGRAAATDASNPGLPAAPVRVGGCLHAAWAGATPTYYTVCQGGVARTVAIPQAKPDGGTLMFRVNRDVVVLNDSATGTSWTLDAELTVVDDWEMAKPDAADPTEAGKDGDTQAAGPVSAKKVACTDTLVLPTAKPDKWGVRAGHPTTLPVLANDSVAGCAIPVITAVRTDAKGGADVGEVVIVDGGRALQITPPEDATGPLPPVVYTVSVGNKLSVNGIVDLRVVPDGTPPKDLQQLRQPIVEVAVSGSNSYNVLDDFISTTGDPLTLLKATESGDFGDDVGFRPDGTVTVTESGRTDPKREIDLQISDGINVFARKLVVSVVPADHAAPTASGVRARVEVGASVVVKPLGEVISPTGVRPRLVKVQAKEQDALTVIPDLARGEVTLAGARPGSYYLDYEVTAAGQQDKGKIRLDVTPAGSGALTAGIDRVYLAPQQDALIDPTVNDSAPGGAPVAVQSVSADPGSSVAAVAVNGQLLRISAGASLPESGEWLTYRLTDGAESATGAIQVVRVTDSRSASAPSAADINRTVRTGDMLAVPLAAFASDPNGQSLTVDQPGTDLQGKAVPGQLFSTTEGIGYRAADRPGTVKVQYTVRNQVGLTASAVLTISIVSTDGENSPPAAPDTAIARVYTGASQDVPLPLEGTDPDGDSVWLADAGRATLGHTSVAGDAVIRYTAGTEPGSEDVRYTVRDSRGRPARGVLHVIVMESPQTLQAPVVPALSATVGPGRATEVWPLERVIDPAGLAVVFNGSTVDVQGAGGVASARIRPDGALEINGHRPGEVLVRYVVRNSKGKKSTGSIQVSVRADAPKPRATAADIFVTPDMVKDNRNATIDVSGSIANIGGMAAALRLSVPPQDARNMTVEGPRTLLVPLRAERSVLTYQVRNDDGSTGTAFVIVPARDALVKPDPAKADKRGADAGAAQAGDRSEQASTAGTTADSGTAGAPPSSAGAAGTATRGAASGAPTTAPGTSGRPSRTATSGPTSGTRPATPTGTERERAPGQIQTQAVDVLTAKAGETVTFALADYVIRDDGKHLEIPAAARPSVGVGTLRRVDAGRLRWQVPADSAGRTTTLTVPVADGAGGTKDVAIEAHIQPGDQLPPTVLSDTMDLEPGQSDAVDLDNLVETSAGQRQKLTFALEPDSTDGISAALDGRTLSVTAADTAIPETVAALQFTVSDGTAEPIAGTVTVTVRRLTVEPAFVPEVTQLVDKDTPTRGNLLADATNPLKKPLTIVTQSYSDPGYRLTVNDDGGYTVTGLAVGSYDIPFTVADGSGDKSRNVAGHLRLTVRGVPDRPDRPQIVALGNGSVTLSWPAPNDNGSPVTGYSVQPSAGQPVACPQTPCAIGELTNGDSYTFRVTATNASGKSAPSLPSASAKPDVAPQTPGNLAVTVGDRHLSTSWDVAKTEGTAIKEYRLTIDPAPAGQPGEIAVTDTHHDFTGLENGTRYEITVRARNLTGTDSDASAAKTGTPATVPSLPSHVEISTGRTAGNSDRIDLTWPPSAGNGDDAVSYRVIWTMNGKPLRADSVEPGAPMAAKITDVTLGAEYAAQVVAHNSRGDSAASAPVSVTPTTAPKALTGLVATPTGESEQVDLTWDPPTDSGVPFDRYQVSVNGGAAVDIDSTKPAATVTAPNGKSSTFRVRWCDNKNTCSDDSTAVPATPYGPPGPVTALTVNADKAAGSLTATWNAPDDNGGKSITGYQVQQGSGPWQDAGSGHEFTGLENGTEYRIKVRALNGGKTEGEPTAVTATPYTAPGAPTLVSAQSQQNGALLSWKQDAGPGGRPINNYQYRVDGGGWQWLAGGTERSKVVALSYRSSGSTRSFEVRAATGSAVRNHSEASGSKQATPYAPLGDASISKSVSSPDVTFSWKGVADGKGRVIMSRSVTWNGGEISKSRNGSTTRNAGWDNTATLGVTICVAPQEDHQNTACKTDKASASTSPKPLPKGSVTAVHGPKHNSGWYLAFKYSNLPAGTYRPKFHFDGDPGNKDFDRPESSSGYDTHLSGSGTWIVTEVPDSSAWYGYYGTVHLTVTNVKTGTKYTDSRRWH